MLDGVCKCGYVSREFKPEDHQWEETTKNPTCTEKGERTSICKICGYVGLKEELPATGHPSTRQECEAQADPGYHTMRTVCNVCGQKVGSSTRVSCSYGAETTVTYASCSKEGLKSKTCKYCGYSLSTTIPKTAHPNTSTSYSKTSHNNHLATKICTVCLTVISKTSGSCSNSWKTTSSATCTSTGLEEYICSLCGQSNDSRSIAKKSHSYTYSSRTYATCTSGGYDLYKCSCGATEKRNTTSSTGHSTTSYSTTGSNCKTSGYSYSRCNKCGWQSASTKNYRYGPHSKTRTGSNTWICTVCGTSGRY